MRSCQIGGLSRARRPPAASRRAWPICASARSTRSSSRATRSCRTRVAARSASTLAWARVSAARTSVIRSESSGGVFAVRTSARVRDHVAPNFASSARRCSSQSARSVTVAIHVARPPRLDRQKSTRASRVPSAERDSMVCWVCWNRSVRRSLSDGSSRSMRWISGLAASCSSRARKNVPASSARRATSATGIACGASAEAFGPWLTGGCVCASAGRGAGAPERRSANARSATFMRGRTSSAYLPFRSSTTAVSAPGPREDAGRGWSTFQPPPSAR